MTTGNPTTLITESNHTVVLTSFKSVYVNNRTNNQEIYCKPALVRVAMKRYSDAKMCICLQRLGLSRHWFSMSHSMEAEVQLWRCRMEKNINAFELWYWRRFQRIPWVAKKSNRWREKNQPKILETQSIRLKLLYFGCEKTYFFWEIWNTEKDRKKEMGMTTKKMDELDWIIW